MRVFRNILVIIVCAVFVISSQAQKKDLAEEYKGNVFSVSLNYGYQFPMADMKELYGNNFNVGLAFEYQLKNNFHMG